MNKQEVNVTATGPPVNEEGDAPEQRKRRRIQQETGKRTEHNTREREDAMTGLLCSFPRWSPEAVITEAARNWNLLHPSQPFDPEGGDWAFTRKVIDSWLRHAVSNYDSICNPENRLALRKEIQHRARVAYPWLNKEFDPRSNAGMQPPMLRPFDQLGRFLAELSSERSAALVALRDAKRKHEDRRSIEALETLVAEADRQMQTLYRMVLPDKHGERDVFIENGNGDYYWAGNRLRQNHIEPLPLTCGDCQARLYRTKRPVSVGGGCRYYIVSCHCSMLFEARKWSMARYADQDGELTKLPPMLRLKVSNK